MKAIALLYNDLAATPAYVLMTIEETDSAVLDG